MTKGMLPSRRALDDTAQDNGPARPLHDQALKHISRNPLGMHRQGIMARHANGVHRARKDEIDVPGVVHLLGKFMLSGRLHDQRNRVR